MSRRNVIGKLAHRPICKFHLRSPQGLVMPKPHSLFTCSLTPYGAYIHPWYIYICILLCRHIYIYITYIRTHILFESSSLLSPFSFVPHKDFTLGVPLNCLRLEFSSHYMLGIPLLTRCYSSLLRPSGQLQPLSESKPLSLPLYNNNSYPSNNRNNSKSSPFKA